MIVRSRRVLTGSFAWQVPVSSPSGFLHGTETRHGYVYETQLDAPHQKAIEEAERLSNSTGLELEVVDLGKENFLRRLLRGALDRDVVPALPEIRLQLPNPAGVSCRLEPMVKSLA